MTVFSSTHEFIKTVSWRILPRHTLGVFPDGTIVVASDSRLPDQIGYPLHLVGRDGSVLRSFGSRDGALYPGSGSMERRIAISGDDHVWAASPWEFRIERWNRDGSLDKVLRRPVIYAEGGEEDDSAPAPSVVALHQDVDGLLWIYILVADPRWRDQLGDALGAHGERPLVGSRHLYRDTIIEVVDPETGDLLARTRMDARAFPVAEKLAGATVPAGEQYDIRYKVWSLEFQR
jgi:hypothetical protein